MIAAGRPMLVPNHSSLCFATLRDFESEIPLVLCKGLNITKTPKQKKRECQGRYLRIKREIALRNKITYKIFNLKSYLFNKC